MLHKRLVVAIILVPVVVLIAALGGWAFKILIAGLLGIAAWELWRIFRLGGFSPSAPIMIAGALLLVLVEDQYPFGFDGSAFVFSLFIMISMTAHLAGYEQGKERSAIDFCITLAGMAYLGWLGKYFILLRTLPNGLWWLLLVLPSAWLMDVGGFLAGTRFGKHKMAPRLSPKKSWEGYIGGVLLSTIGTGLLALLWNIRAPIVTFDKGLILGTVIGIIGPLGDLGESMFKRQFSVKDSSKILPGHGGILDRIDTWLWAAVIGYYWIILFWLS
jgi:phosphatidate cytidylyltransferase